MLSYGLKTRQIFYYFIRYGWLYCVHSDTGMVSQSDSMGREPQKFCYGVVLNSPHRVLWTDFNVFFPCLSGLSGYRGSGKILECSDSHHSQPEYQQKSKLS